MAHSQKAMRAALTGLGALTMLVAASAQAQDPVYRCGSSAAYTDKPCDAAKPVDLRSNLLEAGPTSVPAPAEETPNRPIILQNIGRVVSTPPAPASSIWSRSDNRNAEQTNRTNVSPQPQTSDYRR